MMIRIRDGRVVNEADGLEVLLETREVFDVGSVLVLNARLAARQQRNGSQFDASSFATEDETHRLTSLNNLFPNMPRPPSSQSITGSAYSCIDAVKMTSVYHEET